MINIRYVSVLISGIIDIHKHSHHFFPSSGAVIHRNVDIRKLDGELNSSLVIVFRVYDKFASIILTKDFEKYIMELDI